MDMSIQNNMMAMNANRMFNITTGKKTRSTEKLSSGYRINRAADDAAGLAISEKMRRQIRGLNRAADNIMDGISYCQVADGALNEIHDMLHRMTGLAIQSSNGTNSDIDREYLDQELQQLKDECDRVFKETSFNEHLIWDSPNDLVQIGTEQIRAVNPVSRSSGFDITNENFKVVPYSSMTVHANAGTGISLSWMDYSGKNHETTPASWDEIKANNYSFEISDYYGGPDGSNSDLYDASGNPYYKYQFAFRPIEEATIDDMVAALNGRNISTGASAYIVTEWENGGSGINTSASITYAAEYASRNTAAGISFDALDDGFIEPLKNSTGTNLSVHPEYTSVEQARTDTTGWKFEFNMQGIGKVTATCTGISYSSSDRTPEAQDTWWRYYTSQGRQQITGKSYSVEGNMKGLMSALTGPHGLLSAENGGNNTGSGSVSMSFNLVSDNTFAFGNTSNNRVGSMTLGFGVSPSSTEQNVLDMIKGALNDDTVLDIKKSGTNAESAYISALTPGNNTVDVPVYGGMCNIDIQAGVEAGQYINITYDCLGLQQLGIKYSDIATADSAQMAIDDIKGALQVVSGQRSVFGAYQNRLEHAYNINKNSEENTQAGESQIRDTDMNSEMVEYSKHSILEQAGTSVLAQAQQSRQGMMQLLQ